VGYNEIMLGTDNLLTEFTPHTMIPRMKHQRLLTGWPGVLLLVALGMAILLGCGDRIAERPPTSIEDSVYPLPSRQFPAWKFGAVHYMWTDVYAQPDLNSERLTQCIYGDVLRIEAEHPGWYQVKIGPYPELEGWVHQFAVTVLTPEASYLRERTLKTIMIRQDEIQAFVWPGQSLSLTIGSELPFLGESGEWYLVRLPTNDIGRIPKEAVYLTDGAAPLIQSKHASRVVVENMLQARREIIVTAQKFLGKVYIWGGTTPRGFDCSGLSYFVYKLNGIDLPRVSWLQFRNAIGKKIEKSQLASGDLVFFETYKPGPSHVGIYIGHNQFIHASPTAGVTTSNLDDPYFKKRYIGAKTLFPAS